MPRVKHMWEVLLELEKAPFANGLTLGAADTPSFFVSSFVGNFCPFGSPKSSIHAFCSSARSNGGFLQVAAVLRQVVAFGQPQSSPMYPQAQATPLYPQAGGGFAAASWQTRFAAWQKVNTDIELREAENAKINRLQQANSTLALQMQQANAQASLAHILGGLCKCLLVGPLSPPCLSLSCVRLQLTCAMCLWHPDQSPTRFGGVAAHVSRWQAFSAAFKLAGRSTVPVVSYVTLLVG